MTCPKAKHFHVICRDVFEKDNFEKVFEVPNANIAFESVIKVLPVAWEGSIEVRDDSTLGDRKFPLIDFWRTPKNWSDSGRFISTNGICHPSSSYFLKLPFLLTLQTHRVLAHRSQVVSTSLMPSSGKNGRIMKSPSDVSYWLVGAYDNGSNVDNSSEFIQKGIWINGYDDRSLNRIQSSPYI